MELPLPYGYQQPQPPQLLPHPHPPLHPPHPQSPPNLSRPSQPHPQFAVPKSLILNPPIMMFTVHNMQMV